MFTTVRHYPRLIQTLWVNFRWYFPFIHCIFRYFGALWLRYSINTIELGNVALQISRSGANLRVSTDCIQLSIGAHAFQRDLVLYSIYAISTLWWVSSLHAWGGVDHKVQELI